MKIQINTANEIIKLDPIFKEIFSGYKTPLTINTVDVESDIEDKKNMHELHDTIEAYLDKKFKQHGYTKNNDLYISEKYKSTIQVERNNKLFITIMFGVAL